MFSPRIPVSLQFIIKLYSWRLKLSLKKVLLLEIEYFHGAVFLDVFFKLNFTDFDQVRGGMHMITA